MLKFDSNVDNNYQHLDTTAVSTLLGTTWILNSIVNIHLYTGAHPKDTLLGIDKTDMAFAAALGGNYDTSPGAGIIRAFGRFLLPYLRGTSNLT
eukprot:1157486-Amorphochlora_amoeboformis.AAC.3